jgi:NSS family neurotransmitter:Na+ symporter
MPVSGRVDRKAETWSSGFAFLMAAIGSSVGLGNIWRFPYVAGENGGAAFLILYAACLICVATPLLAVEYAIGRRSQHSAVESVQAIARASGKSELWGAVAWIGMFASFFILTFYSVVAAWLLAYTPLAFTGEFAALFSGDGQASTAAQALFERVTSDRPRILICLAVFVGLAALIVAPGVNRGIERASILLMPLLICLLAGLCLLAVTRGAGAEAFAFLFAFDVGDLSFNMLLAALSQSLFATGVGAAVMMTFGAYLPRGAPIALHSATIAGAGALVSIMGALAVFAFVLAVGGDPASGKSLFFTAVPIALGVLPFAAPAAGLLFLLVVFAALASAIALMETAVSWLDERSGVTRWGAAFGVSFAVFVFGGAYVYSYEAIGFVDVIASGFLLPGGALLLSLFAGWALEPRILIDELGPRAYALIAPLLRWVIPSLIAVALILGGPAQLHAV